MNLLHIDSSILGDNSVSRAISAAAVAALTAEDPSLTVVRRDLGAQPAPPRLRAVRPTRHGPSPKPTRSSTSSWRPTSW